MSTTFDEASSYGASDALLEAKRALEDALRGQGDEPRAMRAEESASPASNVQGVAIGISSISAGPRGESHARGVPGEPTLAVFIAEPAPHDAVRAVVAESLGVSAAATTEEVHLTPVVTGIIDAQQHRFGLRPAPGGVSVGQYQVSAGTIGCLVVGRKAPRNKRLMILSNNHVLAHANDAKIGDCVCQPGPIDGGGCPEDKVATLERFIPLVFGGTPNHVDCATAWTIPDRVRPEIVYLSEGQQKFFSLSSTPVAPQLGMSVGKSGRTTQLTSGRITALGASVWVNYGAGKRAFFENQIAVQGFEGAFSSGGDSGSTVWTWDSTRSPVGLLFAGGGGTTFMNPITAVLDALEVDLYTSAS